MLKKFKMLSVNQINAQIKLCEMWKSVHIVNYPIKTCMLQRSETSMNTRAVGSGALVEVKTVGYESKNFLK